MTPQRLFANLRPLLRHHHTVHIPPLSRLFSTVNTNRPPNPKAEAWVQYYNKRMEDPDYRRRELARQREDKARRLSDDPVYGEKKRSYMRAYYNRHRRPLQLLRNWVTCFPGSTELDWPTHIPVIYTERTEHTCAGCGKRRRGGTKLWWKRRTDPELFDCHTCFCTDLSDALPVGYEHRFLGKDTPSSKSKDDKA